MHASNAYIQCHILTHNYNIIVCAWEWRRNNNKKLTVPFCYVLFVFFYAVIIIENEKHTTKILSHTLSYNKHESKSSKVKQSKTKTKNENNFISVSGSHTYICIYIRISIYLHTHLFCRIRMCVTIKFYREAGKIKCKKKVTKSR